MVGNVPLALRLTDAPGPARCLRPRDDRAALLLRGLRRDEPSRGQHRRVLHLRRPRPGQAARRRGGARGRAVVQRDGHRADRWLRLLRAGRARTRPASRCRWIPLAAIGWAITAYLGYRSVELSAKVLAVLMSAEVVILTIFDLAVVGQDGVSALRTGSFAPSTVFSASLGHLADVRVRVLHRLRVRRALRRGGRGPEAQHPPRHHHRRRAHRRLLLPHLVGDRRCRRCGAGGRAAGRRRRQPGLRPGRGLPRRDLRLDHGGLLRHERPRVAAGDPQRGQPLHVRPRPGRAAPAQARGSSTRAATRRRTPPPRSRSSTRWWSWPSPPSA